MHNLKILKQNRVQTNKTVNSTAVNFNGGFLFNNYPNNFKTPTQGWSFNLVRSYSEVISLKKIQKRTAADGLTGPQMRSIGEFSMTTRIDCRQARHAVDSSRMRLADLHCAHQPHL
jgi:hypothetical protein